MRQTRDQMEARSPEGMMGYNLRSLGSKLHSAKRIGMREFEEEAR